MLTSSLSSSASGQLTPAPSQSLPGAASVTAPAAEGAGTITPLMLDALRWLVVGGVFAYLARTDHATRQALQRRGFVEHVGKEYRVTDAAWDALPIANGAA